MSSISFSLHSLQTVNRQYTQEDCLHGVTLMKITATPIMNSTLYIVLFCFVLVYAGMKADKYLPLTFYSTRWSKIHYKYHVNFFSL